MDFLQFIIFSPFFCECFPALIKNKILSLSLTETTSIPPVASPLTAVILPGPIPLTTILAILIPLRIILAAAAAPVACPARVVFFFEFLKPSIPAVV